MSQGRVSELRRSDVKVWEIPEFFRTVEQGLEQGQYLESPLFPSHDCTWRMRVYPKGYRANPFTVQLIRTDLGIDTKTVTFTIVLDWDGYLQDCGMHKKVSFKGGDLYSIPLTLDQNPLYPDNDAMIEGKLTLTCRMKCKKTRPRRIADMEIVDLESLSSDLEDLLNSDNRTCDVTIRVQGMEFQAHRIVLSARSPVFRTMFEHDTEEAKTGTVSIPDCSPDTFDRFLKFLYTGRAENVVSFREAYNLHAATHKYDVRRLKWLCGQCLIQKLTPDNFCKLVLMADIHHEELLASAQDYFNMHFRQIFLRSEWKALMKDNLSLADRFMSRMADHKRPPKRKLDPNYDDNIDEEDHDSIDELDDGSIYEEDNGSVYEDYDNSAGEEDDHNVDEEDDETDHQLIHENIGNYEIV